MKRIRRVALDSQSGFTLVESLIVLVVMSIAAVGIISLQGNILSGQADNKDLQVGVQLMQECAEQILAARQLAGYTAITASTCSALGNFGGFGAPTVTVTAYSDAACPGGGTCEKVDISLSKAGASLKPVTLMLAGY